MASYGSGTIISNIIISPILRGEASQVSFDVEHTPAQARQYGDITHVVVSVYTGKNSAKYYMLTKLESATSKTTKVPFAVKSGEKLRFASKFYTDNVPVDTGSDWYNDNYQEYALRVSIYTENASSVTTYSIDTSYDTYMRVLARRYNPIITSYDVSDVSTAYSIFGLHVQRECDFRASAACTVDPYDPTASVSRYDLAVTDSLGTRMYTSKTGDFSIGALDQYGTATFDVTVYDNKGGSASQSIERAITQYKNPSIGVDTFVRKTDVLDDQGNVVWVDADDGERVSSSGTVSVTPISGTVGNAWALSVEYRLPNRTLWETALSMSSTDGSAYAADWSYDQDDITNAQDVPFRYTLSDKLHTVAVEYSAYKSSAILDVEQNGVAIGMRSTGSDASKLFEVAWPMYTYDVIHAIGGIVDASGNPVGNSYTAGEQEVGTWLGRPLYRKVFEHGQLTSGTHGVGTADSFGGLIRAFASAQSSTGSCYNTDVVVAYNGTVSTVLTSDAVSGVVVVEYLHGTIDVYATYPAAAMTAASSQNCTVSAYSEYSTTWAAWKAFDKKLTDAWASKALPNADQPQWIQIHMPHKLRNISVSITNRIGTPVAAPKTGRVLGANSIDGDTSSGGNSDSNIWHQIGTFNNLPSTASTVSKIVCNNADVGYRYIRIEITDATSTTFVYVGNIDVTGIVAD